MTSKASDLRRALLFGACALPVGFMVWLSNVPDLEVPLLDHWIFLDFFVRVMSGEATLHDLFAPHGRIHITASLRLVLGALAFLTSWSLRAEAVAGMALLLLSTLVLLRVSKHPSEPASTPRAVATFTTVLLMWSPVCFYAFAWTIGFVHFFTNACVIFAVACLEPGTAGRGASNRRFALACALCVVGSFARVEGLFAWLSLLPLVFASSGTSSFPRRRLVAWASLALMCWVVWGLAVANPPHPTGRESQAISIRALAYPHYVPLNVLGLLGFPLGRFIAETDIDWKTTIVAWPAGLAVLVAFCALGTSIARRRDIALLRRSAPWLCLATHALLFVGAVALGRIALPKSSMIVDIYLSMYSTTTVLFPIAVVQLAMIVITTMPTHRARQLATTAIGGVLAAALVSAASALPSALVVRELWRGKGPCIDLALYLAKVNNCFAAGRPPAREVTPLQRSGFRRIVEEIERAEPVPGLTGGFLERSTVDSTRARLSGWVDVPDGMSGGVVVLSRSEEPDQIAWLAHDDGSRSGRRRWTVVHTTKPQRIPGEPETLRLWLYDRSTETLFPIERRAQPD